MPVTRMRFENGVFYAREVGDILADDAREWATGLRQAAESCPSPIVALVDAMDIGFVHPEARNIFAEASHTLNVRVIAVAVSSILAVEAARTVVMRGAPGKTYTFVTLTEARGFALRMLDSAAMAFPR